MDLAIYIQSNINWEVNNNELSLLVQRAKLEGGNYKIFSEITGKKSTQPLKADLLTRVYKKEFDTILVYKLSDWAFPLAKLSSELKELQRKDVRLISIFENFDSCTPTGSLYLQMLQAFSEFEKTVDPEIPEETSGKVGVVKQFTRNQRAERKIIEGSSVSLNNFQGKILSEDIERSGNNLIPVIMTKTGKDSGNANNFDLIGLKEACLLTGYSKHTVYQLTSRKLIPHFKRPRGRRIFFSKRALEQWIKTGGI